MPNPRDEYPRNDSLLPPLSWVAILALAQGSALLGLTRAVEADFYPFDHPMVWLPLGTAAVAIPLVMHLSLTTTNLPKLLKGSITLFGLLIVCAFYAGWTIHPVPKRLPNNIIQIFSISATIATFIGTAFLQQRVNNIALNYRVIFENSWHNFLTCALAAAFVLGVTGVLGLWSSLFKVVGIVFFEDLFWNDWFLFPVLSVAFGFGVLIFRRLQKVIAGISSLLEGLIRLLLPMLALLAVLFATTLPFVGMQPLWDTDNGTMLMLWLIALVLFCSNAVFQTGPSQVTYPGWVQTGICLGILTLPIYAAISCYGLSVRIAEYGWTVSRAWGMVAWLLLTAFALGYSYGVIRLRHGWPQMLATTNMRMAWLIIAILVLANSPLLDFKNISLASQIARVESGKITWHEFDFYYTKRYLGRTGHALTEELKATHPDDVALLGLIKKPTQPWGNDKQLRDHVNPAEHLHFLTEPVQVPEAVMQSLLDTYMGSETKIFIVQADLSRNNQLDIVAIVDRNDWISSIDLYHQDDQQRWLKKPLRTPYNGGLQKLLDENPNPAVTTPSFDQLILGNKRFQVEETDHL